MTQSVDLPESLATAASKAAAALGLSPDEFYRQAIAQAVKSARRPRQDVTDAVNAVWDNLTAEEKQSEMRVLDSQATLLIKEDW